MLFAETPFAQLFPRFRQDDMASLSTVGEIITIRMHGSESANIKLLELVHSLGRNVGFRFYLPDIIPAVMKNGPVDANASLCGTTFMLAHAPPIIIGLSDVGLAVRKVQAIDDVPFFHSRDYTGKLFRIAKYQTFPLHHNWNVADFACDCVATLTPPYGVGESKSPMAKTTLSLLRRAKCRRRPCGRFL